MNTAPSSGRPASAAPALRFTKVSKSFGGTLALDEVSFDIFPATVHALCGGNGSGKSTLIKILAGVHQADSGTIEIDGHTHEAARTNPGWAAAQGLHFVHQSIGTFASLTVAENFAIGSSFDARCLAPVPWRSLHRRVRGVLERFDLDVSPRTLMVDVPPATRTMIAVARALQDDDTDGSATLVLDEPTAALPPEEASILLEAMRGYAQRGHAVVFVSHRLTELMAVSDDATFLRDGRHIGTHAVATLNQERLVELITGHGTVPAATRSAGRGDQPARLVLRDYSVGPLESISLEVGAGEIVGLAGLLGAGRSTLLQSLFGAHPARAGHASIDGKELRVGTTGAAIAAGIAYVPEDRAGQAAFADLSTRSNFTAPRAGSYWNRLWIRRSSERGDTSAAIERYQIKVAGPEANFATMSGGNQQKVVLARWLECKPKVLLLDEPTQGVDIGARNAIHELVRGAAAAGAAVVVVSSDVQELVDLSDRVIGLHAGRISGQVSGPDLNVRRCTEISHGFGTTSDQTGTTVDARQPANRAGRDSPTMTTETQPPVASTETEHLAVAPGTPRRTGSSSNRWLALGERLGLLVLLVGVSIVWSARYPETFATSGNWQVIASSQSVNLVIALAIMVPLLSNNFDLSVGSTATLSAMIAAGFMARESWGLLTAILAVLAMGLLIGLANGLLVTRLGLNGLIATIGSATVLDGLQSWYSGNTSIFFGISQSLVDFGTATAWKVPWLAVVALLLALVTGYVITQTPVGRRLVAMGSSNEAARLVGVRVDRLVLASYMTSGLLAAAAGVLMLAQQGSANPSASGVGILLPALAAVYLGASTWTPGQFNVVGTILGLLLVSVTVSGLTLAGSAPWVGGVANGTALILAVGASAAFRRKRRGA